MAIGKHCRTILAAALVSIGVVAPQTASANTTYPSQPIRLIIPFGAGGITDVAGRLIGQYLAEALSQQIVVENRPGAGGAIAAQALATAKPDGYTLLLGTVGTQVVNPMLYTRLNYDPGTFTPVSLVSNSPYVMAIGDIEGVTDLHSLVAHAKENPGDLNFGSAGNGSSPHLGLELFKMATGTDIMHIPFKSGAEAVNAALGGQVHMVIDALPVISPHAASGRLKMLAIAAAERSPAAPDLKTSVEEGLPEFQIGSWNALVAPPGTPEEPVEVLNKALAEVMARPELVSRLTEMGIQALPTGVEAYQKHVASESEKWSRVIETAGTRLD